jgi:putative ABC transport system permease protein
MHLGEAQKLLAKPGLITGMKAINCECRTEELDGIAPLIEGILPGVKVILDKPRAVSRSQARESAGEAARKALEAEKLQHQQTLEALESASAVLVPLITVGCAVWLAFLTYGNVRARRTEVGILRAMGVRTSQILWLFLVKAIVIGLVGAGLGVAAGLAIGGGTPRAANPWLFALVVVVSPLLAVVASWLPAQAAARQDPAVALREE